MADPTSSQRQNLVSVDQIPGFWAEATGREVEADVSDAWNGGELEPEKLASPPTTGNIVLRRPYKPRRDGSIVRQLTAGRRVGSWRTTVSIQDTDAELNPIGQPWVYAGALLTAVRPPDFDASSGDPQVIDMEFAVRGVA